VKEVGPLSALRQVERRAKEMTPQPFRTAAKGILRAFGVATSPIRSLPDFMVIGTKRGGTTSLYNYLLAHPNVGPLFPAVANIKGIHFFDRKFLKGPAWYRSHFPTVLSRFLAPGRLVGEASPYYLASPGAPRRARSLVPDTKLIVLLRNPVERAYSHYKERRRNGVEPLEFDEAIRREEERLAGELERMHDDPDYVSFAHEHYSYLRQGIYLPQLQSWMAEYPRDQFCILRSEDFFKDPGATYGQVLRFLELPPWQPPSFRRFNFHPAEDMPASLREELLAFFRPHNELLAEFLGVDLRWQEGSRDLEEHTR
jgi:hypothetical protein